MADNKYQNPDEVRAWLAKYVVSGYEGASLSDIFREVPRDRKIVFLDEFDQVADKSGELGAELQRELLTYLNEEPCEKAGIPIVKKEK